MSDQEPEGNESALPEISEPPALRRRPLPLVLVWGLAPAMLVILAGVCMELKPGDIVITFLLILGMAGGIPALLFWSIWMVYPMNWKTPTKVVAVIPMFIGMCALNLFLASCGCAIIAPPQ